MRSRKFQKILIIRMSSIGDVILTSPVVRQLRERFPDAQIDFLIRTEFAEIMRHNPRISNLIEFDTDAAGEPLKEMRAFVRGQKYDLILDLHRNLRSIYIRRFLGHPQIYKINKNRLARFFLVNTHLNLYKFLKPYPLSVAHKYLRVGRRAQLDPQDMTLELHLPEQAKAKAETIWQALYDEGFRVVMAPGAKHFTKRWPPAYYAKLIKIIYDELGWKSLLVGGPAERTMIDGIQNRAGEEAMESVAGSISLLETMAVISEGTFFISNDSGLMHVAAAYQKPQIAIFGSTTRDLGFFPVNPNATIVENHSVDCRPCTHIGKTDCPKEHFKCMLDITPEDVFSVMRQKVIESGL